MLRAPRNGASHSSRIDHFAHQIIERDLMMPAIFFLRLARIANQRIHVRWPKISRVNFNQNATFSSSKLNWPGASRPVARMSQENLTERSRLGN